MALLDPYLLAELHREVYVAILNSWVPYGRRGDCARRAGISPVFLSLLCQLDHPARAGAIQRRRSSRAVAERLAAALPAPQEIRASLIEHMAKAHAERHAGQGRVHTYLAQRRLPEVMTGLVELHGRATFNADPAQSERAYRGLRAAATEVVAHLFPRQNPAS